MKVTEALPVTHEELEVGIEFDAHLERAREQKFEELKADYAELLADGKGAKLIDDSMRRMLALGASEKEATAENPIVPSPPMPPEMKDGKPADAGVSLKPVDGKKPKPKQTRERKDNTHVIDESKVETIEHKSFVHGDARTCEECGVEKGHMGWLTHVELEYKPARPLRAERSGRG